MRRKENSEMSRLDAEKQFFWNDNQRSETKTAKAKKKWIRCKEAMKMYEVSRPTIMKWAGDAGGLLKIDATVLIDPEAVDRYLETFRIPGAFC